MADPALSGVELVAETLLARRWRLVTAESCTGGLIAAQATALAGSSAWFDQGFVTYSNDAKIQQLGVEESLLARFGAVSEPVAQAMAVGALLRSRAQISVAVTGIAGPTGAVPGKPVGTVWIAWAWRAADADVPQVMARLHQFGGDRQAVRAATAAAAWAGCAAQLQTPQPISASAHDRHAESRRTVQLAWCAEMSPALRQTWTDQLRPPLAAVAQAEGVQLVWLTDDQLAQADIAIVAQPSPVAWNELTRSPRLRWVQSLWAGVDRLLDWAPLPDSVQLTRMVDPALREAMVGAAVWAVIGLHRGFDDYRTQQQQARWQPRPQRRPADCEVLVLGRGALGSAVARQLRELGYRVSSWGGAWATRADTQAALLAWPGDAADAGPTCSAPVASASTALSRADIVINLLPLTPATRGLLDAQLFQCLKLGAHLVNLARGGHVVEGDLLEALASGRIARAVLDVFETEPLPAQHPFWNHPQVTVWPHVAALTDPRTASLVVANNLRRWLRQERLAHPVDRDNGY